MIWHCINCLLSQAIYRLNASWPLLISSAFPSSFRMAWKDIRTGFSGAVAELSVTPKSLSRFPNVLKSWKAMFGSYSLTTTCIREHEIVPWKKLLNHMKWVFLLSNGEGHLVRPRLFICRDSISSSVIDLI